MACMMCPEIPSPEVGGFTRCGILHHNPPVEQRTFFIQYSVSDKRVREPRGNEQKTRHFSYIVPGKTSYTFETDESYLDHYATCFFALTSKKAGWDSMRTLEIIASGCVPYFVDLADCPPTCLMHLPKDLLAQVPALPGMPSPMSVERCQETGNVECLEFDTIVFRFDLYTKLLNDLHDWLKQNLTTRVSANRFLNTCQNLVLPPSSDPIERILVFSEILWPSAGEYLRDSLLIGLMQEKGSNSVKEVTVLQHPSFLFCDSDISEYPFLYGKGFGYAHQLPPASDTIYVRRTASAITDLLSQFYYDLVVVHITCNQPIPQWIIDMTQPYMNHPIERHRLVVIDGSDIIGCHCSPALTTFRRECVKMVRQKPVKKDLNKKNAMHITVGFLLYRGYSSEIRGGHTTVEKYATHNERVLKNKSLILFEDGFDETSAFFVGLKSMFTCVHKITSVECLNAVVLEHTIDIVYHQIYGNAPSHLMCTVRPNAVHAVFVASRFTERYASVSKTIAQNGNVPWVPHIVDIRQQYVQTPENIRKQRFRAKYGIPETAVVFGRHGGYTEFDIQYVQECVTKLACAEASHIWFVFVQTAPFAPSCGHIIHTPSIWEEEEKCDFIAACDAMLHARQDGETFGMAIAEFSACSKPVITTIGRHNTHLTLNPSAFVFKNTEELSTILLSFPRTIDEDLDMYTQKFNAETVMRTFEREFLSGIVHVDQIHPSHDQGFSDGLAE